MSNKVIVRDSRTIISDRTGLEENGKIQNEGPAKKRLTGVVSFEASLAYANKERTKKAPIQKLDNYEPPFNARKFEADQCKWTGERTYKSGKKAVVTSQRWSPAEHKMACEQYNARKSFEEIAKAVSAVEGNVRTKDAIREMLKYRMYCELGITRKKGISEIFKAHTFSKEYLDTFVLA